MSKLLINEPPLQVLPTLAQDIGLHEAIILQQIHYWVEINQKAEKNFKDGYFWTYNSYQAWQRQFPFWTLRTIKGIIAKLEDQGLLIAGSFNKAKFDRTKWYRIDHKRLAEIECERKCKTCTMEGTSFTPTIPETNQIYKPEHEIGMLTLTAEALGRKPRKEQHGLMALYNQHPESVNDNLRGKANRLTNRLSGGRLCDILPKSPLSLSVWPLWSVWLPPRIITARLQVIRANSLIISRP